MNDLDIPGQTTFEGGGGTAGAGVGDPAIAAPVPRVYDAGASGRLATMQTPRPAGESETRGEQLARRRRLVKVTFSLPEPLADALEKHAADASSPGEAVNPAEIVGGLLVRLMRDTRQSANVEAELADAFFAYVGGEIDILVNRRHLIDPKAHRR